MTIFLDVALAAVILQAKGSSQNTVIESSRASLCFHDWTFGCLGMHARLSILEACGEQPKYNHITSHRFRAVNYRTFLVTSALCSGEEGCIEGLPDDRYHGGGRPVVNLLDLLLYGLCHFTSYGKVANLPGLPNMPLGLHCDEAKEKTRLGLEPGQNERMVQILEETVSCSSLRIQGKSSPCSSPGKEKRNGWQVIGGS